jgi:hypothetical protein
MGDLAPYILLGVALDKFSLFFLFFCCKGILGFTATRPVGRMAWLSCM